MGQGLEERKTLGRRGSSYLGQKRYWKGRRRSRKEGTELWTEGGSLVESTRIKETIIERTNRKT